MWRINLWDPAYLWDGEMGGGVDRRSNSHNRRVISSWKGYGYVGGVRWLFVAAAFVNHLHIFLRPSRITKKVSYMDGGDNKATPQVSYRVPFSENERN